jgi:hypothetical protein
MFRWDSTTEARVLHLKNVEKKTYPEIAASLGTTASSVKHKYVRLNQKSNEDRHHHPEEKTTQIRRVLCSSDLSILETNSGWGNLTGVYQEYGDVLTLDIDAAKIEYIQGQPWENVEAIKTDSLKEIYRLIYQGKRFDVVDLDPYGFPSRYFPHVFQLLDDGFLFVTFPKMGVQQVNKIMIEHYRIFWGISLSDKAEYESKIHSMISDYALQHFRSCELVDTVDLGRMYRFAYRVKRESALDLVGLRVSR